MAIIEEREPGTKPRVCVVRTAQYWFDAAKKAQANGDAFAALGFMENAFNHTENALVTVLRVGKFKHEPPATGRKQITFDELRAELDALSSRPTETRSTKEN
jgi:hypothetical protein